MNLQEIISAFRDDADDQIAPFLWDDPFLVGAANRAEAEACKSGLLITDSSTSSVISYALTGSTTTVSLHSSVIRIKRAKLASQSYPLTLITVAELDTVYPNWDSDARNQPLFLITDIETKKVQLYPLSDTTDTLNLHVWRVPITLMSAMTDAPEIEDLNSNHRKLVNWMLYEAYMKHDSDKYDPVKATDYRNRFAADFGDSTPRGAEWRRQNLGRSMLGGRFTVG